MQALLTATGQNIKRLLKHTPSHHRPEPLIPKANALPRPSLDFMAAIFDIAFNPAPVLFFQQADLAIYSI
jgi:hypothetical protein